jgi:DNA (cytosine-5)-methyltransferase 1
VIGSLFSGIGGLELGLERAGLGPTVWQCEIDPFCRLVLAKHWPNAERFTDVTTLVRPPPVDILCGGFPCQDVSSAGAGAGLSGARSGLWYEYRRIVSEIRPKIVIVENVASGKRRWLPHVRRDLHVLGYRTRAFALSAEEVGAWHLRRRVFVVAADPERVQLREQSWWSGGSDGTGEGEAGDHGQKRTSADPDGDRQSPVSVDAEVGWSPEAGDAVPAGREGANGLPASRGRILPTEPARWPPECGVVPVVYGLPGGLVGRQRRRRIRALGNSVVPQCAEVIGRIVNDLL